MFSIPGLLFPLRAALPLVFVLAGIARADMFSNPVVPPDSADPFVCYHSGNYYLICTHGDLRPKPGEKSLHTEVAVYASPTLGGLNKVEPVVVQEMNEFLESPELWHLGNHWYIYCTTPHSEPGQSDVNYVHVLESDADDPLGPYHNQGIIQTGLWDGTLLQMKGKTYFLSSSGRNLWIQEMLSPTKAIGHPTRLSQQDQPWEREGHLAKIHLMEAPEVLHHGDDYFILYTAGDYRSNDYRLGALKYQGGNPRAPSSWKKIPGPLFQGNGGRSRGAGDCTPFLASDGTYWFAYSAWESAGPGAMRSVRVQKMEDFEADGYPKFPAVNNPGDPMKEPPH
jgi:GH43 family beta-xylosidase